MKDHPLLLTTAPLHHPFSSQGLLQQAQGYRLPWTRILLLVLIFAIGFLCHDFQSHSSFQGKRELAGKGDNVRVRHRARCSTPWPSHIALP